MFKALTSFFRPPSEVRSANQYIVQELRIVNQYTVISLNECIILQVHYDHPKEFSGTLNIVANEDKFVSLNFQLHQKNNTDNDLLLSILNTDEKGLIVYCMNLDNDTHVKFMVSPLETTMKKLLDSLIAIKNHFSNKVFSDDFNKNHPKEVLGNFTNIGRNLLTNSDPANLFHVISEVLHLESNTLKTLKELSEPAMTKGASLGS